MKFSTTLHADGKGLWSSETRAVKTTKIECIRNDVDCGEVRVYFTKRSWDPDKHGLIYTDEQWLKELRKAIRAELGFTVKAARDVDYSEQGMQGDNYVSLECGEDFLANFISAGGKFVEDFYAEEQLLEEELGCSHDRVECIDCGKVIYRIHGTNEYDFSHDF